MKKIVTIFMLLMVAFPSFAADTKISNLPALGAAPATNDLIPIVDVSTSLNKKLTIVELFTSPTLVTPNIGTPSAGVLTNATGLPISTGVSGLGSNVATFLATPSSANLASALTGETGSGAAVFGTSPTIATPTISGAITFSDGDKQVFNPNGTNAGLNVGAHTADPSSPANGDLFYDSDDNLLRAYIDGAWVSLGAGGGGGIGGSTGSADNLLLRSDGTGGATLQASGLTIADVASNNLTITTITDTALTLATLDNNRNINLVPHGTGEVVIDGVLTNPSGDFRIEGTDVLILHGPSYTKVEGQAGNAQIYVGLNGNYVVSANPIIPQVDNSSSRTIGDATYRWYRGFFGPNGIKLGDSTNGPTITTTGTSPDENLVLTSAGTGSITLTGPTTFTGAITFPDGVRQVFNPNGTNSGFNVGAHTADPSSPTDGDIFYDSDDELLRARINGSWVSLAGGGGSGDVTAASSFGTDNVLIRSDGTGKGVKSTGITVNDSNELSGVAEINATTGNVDVLMVNGTDIEDLLDAKAPLASPTFTGTVTLPATVFSPGAHTLGENASIALDPAGSADGKYSGTTITGTAGATLAFGDLIVLDPTDSRWELADANSAAAADGDSRGMIGICVLAAAADGDPTVILLQGTVRADAAFPTLTVNGTVFISETAGDIVDAFPTTEDAVIRGLGTALTANEIYFNPSSTWITYDEP